MGAIAFDAGTGRGVHKGAQDTGPERQEEWVNKYQMLQRDQQ